MKLNNEQMEVIRKFFEYESDAKLRTNYSGRCMYGDKCIGIVSDNPTNDLVKLVIHLMENDEAQLANSLSHSRRDNMGLEEIIYFPRIQWDEKVESEDEEMDEEELEAE